MINKYKTKVVKFHHVDTRLYLRILKKLQKIFIVTSYYYKYISTKTLNRSVTSKQYGLQNKSEST